MFTEKEDKEFININAGAFDLLRVKAKIKGEMIPLWLCMSEEAKEEARLNFINYFRENSGIALEWSNELIESFISNVSMTTLVSNWKKMELIAKDLRDQGNPGAYFV